MENMPFLQLDMLHFFYLTYVVVARADCGLAPSGHDVDTVEVGAVLTGHATTA